MQSTQVLPDSVTVNGQTIDLSGLSSQWKRDVVALKELLAARYCESGKKRYVVAFAGPSGSSKSTTAKLLEHLLRTAGVPAVTAGQDGYHFLQSHLQRATDREGRPLAEHKGRYDSFDVSAIKSDLEGFACGGIVAFPEYSRQIHDPVAGAIRIDGAALLLFEGLWLLYDSAPWNELLPLYDLSIFFCAGHEMRKRNTIVRHVRGGSRSPADAELFYQTSDARNAELILTHIAKHDLDFAVS